MLNDQIMSQILESTHLYPTGIEENQRKNQFVPREPHHLEVLSFVSMPLSSFHSLKISSLLEKGKIKFCLWGSIEDQDISGKNKPEHGAATASPQLGCWTQQPQPYLGFPTKAFHEEISINTF